MSTQFASCSQHSSGKGFSSFNQRVAKGDDTCWCWLQSAKGLFEHHLVDNVVMEYSPGAYEGNQKWEDYPSIPGMLE